MLRVRLVNDVGGHDYLESKLWRPKSLRRGGRDEQAGRPGTCRSQTADPTLKNSSRFRMGLQLIVEWLSGRLGNSSKFQPAWHRVRHRMNDLIARANLATSWRSNRGRPDCDRPDGDRKVERIENTLSRIVRAFVDNEGDNH